MAVQTHSPANMRVSWAGSSGWRW